MLKEKSYEKHNIDALVNPSKMAYREHRNRLTKFENMLDKLVLDTKEFKQKITFGGTGHRIRKFTDECKTALSFGGLRVA